MEDFRIYHEVDPLSTVIDIPNQGRYLFVSPRDNFFADNTDPDGDYAVRISVVVRGDDPMRFIDLDQNNMISDEDIELLSMHIREGTGHSGFDVNHDGTVGGMDHSAWVHAVTWYGDATLDGEFNSLDLVSVLQAGQYQDVLTHNSTWATGDWNMDREFDRFDVVLALQDGGYGQGPRPGSAVTPGPSSMASVPEPPAVLLLGLGVLAVCASRRRLGAQARRPPYANRA